jgi:hypothetical protein
MRVCFYHLEDEWSGRARAFADAADVLKERGSEVTVVCARGGAVERRFRDSGHEVIALRTDGGWLRMAWRLRAVLRRSFVEVVFVHSNAEQLEAAAAIWLADRGAVVRRVPPLAPFPTGRHARLARRLAATGFLFSRDDDLRAALPPKGALEPAVAPPGVLSVPAATAAQRVATPPGALTMPAAAAAQGVAAQPAGVEAARAIGTRTVVILHDQPNRVRVSVALGAIALLAVRHPELRATLVGPFHDRDNLRIHAAALRIGDIVEVVDGAASRAVVQDCIATAELALVLADGDDAAFGILDCFAAGLPVITERTALSAALVTDGQTGALTAGLDAAGYAALLASLLAGHSRRDAQAARAVAGRWPLSAMVDGFERAATTARDRSRWRV